MMLLYSSKCKQVFMHTTLLHRPPIGKHVLSPSNLDRVPPMLGDVTIYCHLDPLPHPNDTTTPPLA